MTHLSKSELKGTIRLHMLEILMNGGFRCERCGSDALLPKGHSDDEWISRSNRQPRLCYKCLGGDSKQSQPLYGLRKRVQRCA
jgi:hypothetical protein